jgi:tRNA-splicing ligase RtcB
MNIPLQKIDDYRWQIPVSYKQGMRVPGIAYADEKMLEHIFADNALEQVANVACLPGIVRNSLAMPDIHWGYGFPIGGVAAMDPEDGGVISPGGVGYDINCLLPDSKVLLSNGYRILIKELEAKWREEKIICIDFKTGEKKTAEIIDFLKKKSNNNVYRMITESGDEIRATSDHPFWTADGMIPIGKLREGDLVAISPFVGVDYEKPADDEILNKEDIRKYLLSMDKASRGNCLQQTLSFMEKIGLLPIKYNSLHLSPILRIMGFLFGDGTIRFNKKKGKGVSWFYGKRSDLEEIRKDIEELGFTSSRIYSRERTHKVNTAYDYYEFSVVEESFRVSSTAFVSLMAVLGVPVGKKVSQSYTLPSWIKKCPLWQKRLFLASLFGAEMNSPKSVYKYNFHAPCMGMNKTEKYLKNGIYFINELKDLLKEFGIESQDIGVRKENINREGFVNYRIRLIVSSTTDNLIRFYKSIGFEYHNAKKIEAGIVLQYLKLKEGVIKVREKAEKEAMQMYKSGISPSGIYSCLESKYVNKRFLERSIFDRRNDLPRIAYSFPGYERYKKTATIGLSDGHYVWEKIKKIEKINYEGYVYDITVNHPNHNFIADGFVVSNCGVRLIRTDLTLNDVSPKIDQLMHSLFRDVPCGVGEKGEIRVNVNELKKLVTEGTKWAVNHGYGDSDDIEFTEQHGCMDSADPETLSPRAIERGLGQSGTLGSGNHFLEVQLVEKIFETDIANVFGLFEGQITVMIHSGSRGFGYQICDDSLKYMGQMPAKYGFSIPDRQLASAPANSPEGQRYFAQMSCAANYAWANRQALMHLARKVFENIFGKGYKALGMRLVYDVAHNIAKMENYEIDGKIKKLCVHRKGATRAFPAGHAALPSKYKNVGQPVIVPGDMGRNSYVMVGTQKAIDETFGSVCHGAGRLMSRSKALKELEYNTLVKQLKEKGIVVVSKGKASLLEEAPDAYKDVNDVVKIVHNAEIAKMVARMRPLGVIKG